jgi:para-nitrobenzyl esterase
MAASNNFPSHNGQRLAEEAGAIIVAPNYRLGPFGFLAHSALAAEEPAYASSGNYGLLDQRAALVWVRDNIAQFGGDPGNVTLAGTSAGADSVGLHLISPGSGGLFHRAIVESGYPTVRWTTHAEGAAQADAFAAALGCTDPSQVLACMRSKTRDQVLLALSQATQQVAEPPNRFYWQPVVDSVEIPDQPRTLYELGAFHRVPTIIGANRDEGWGRFVDRSFPGDLTSEQYEAWVTSEFGENASSVLAVYPAANFSSPKEALGRVVGDGQFVCEARRLARLIAGTAIPTFLYSFDYEVPEVSAFFQNHVTHGLESNIIFGNDYAIAAFTPVPHVLNDADRALHAAMAGYWTRFAAGGDPGGDGELRWTSYGEPRGGRGARRDHMVFDTVVRRGDDLREEECDFWSEFFFGTMLGKFPASTTSAGSRR